MKPRSSWLPSLLNVRGHREHDALAELTEAVQRRKEKEALRARAEKREAEHRAQIATIEREEEALFQAGRLKVGDLQRALVWRARMNEVAEKLAHSTALARTAEENALALEQEAKQSLSERRSENVAVKNVEAKWLAESKKAALLEEEENALEAWRPRKP